MIKYVTGDATRPIGEGNKLIIHISNDMGGWGAGFVLALSKKWSLPESVYRAEKKYVLGNVQLVQVESDVYVINMIAQHGVKPTFITYPNAVVAIPPIRYGALLECLKKVAVHAKTLNATIHAPKFGAGLSGGDWGKIEQIIYEALSDVDVTIYDLK